MRPPGVKSSPLQRPLDEAFASPAQVRLIRTLSNYPSAPLSVADAARFSGLTPAGARRALQRLADANVVERVGSGRAQKWALKEGWPITQPLRVLFATEEQQYDDLIAGLRRSIDLAEVRAAWVDHLPILPNEPLTLMVVVEAAALPWIREELGSRLNELERDHDVAIEIDAYTVADRRAPSSDGVVLLATEADEPVARQARLTHSDAEDRSFRMAQAIAELLEKDPSLLRRATQHLNRLIHEGPGLATGDLAEWRQLLETYSPNRIRSLLVSRSSRGERLRQSSPFFAVLTPSERDFVVARIGERSDS